MTKMKNQTKRLLSLLAGFVLAFSFLFAFLPTHVNNVNVARAEIREEDGKLVQTVVAEVQPSSATNKNVLFTIAWTSEETEGEIADYIELRATDNTCDVICKQPFKGKNATLTVTTEDGGYTDTLSVIYNGIASKFTATPQEQIEIVDGKYQLYTNKSYNFDLSASNIFGETDFVSIAEITPFSRPMIYGDEYTTKNGVRTWTSIKAKYINLDSMQGNGYISASVLNNVLRINVNEKLLGDYSSDTTGMGPETLVIGTDLITEDVFKQIYGENETFDAGRLARENQQLLDDGYLSIRLKEAKSNLTLVVNFNILQSATGVDMPDGDIIF